MYLRIFLFALLVYLLVRMVRQFFDSGNKDDDNDIRNTGGGKKVSGDTGEYVDYEEIKD